MPKVIEVPVFAVVSGEFVRGVQMWRELAEDQCLTGERVIPAVLTLDLEKKP